ncbi:MAG TPA: S8 family serine peptidase [Candidatus Angelobacter sp.]
MAKGRITGRTLCLFLLLLGLPLMAEDKYVLVTSPSKVQDVCSRHGLQPVSQLSSSSSAGVFLVSTASIDPTLATDSDVQSFELNRTVGVPELSGLTVSSLTQSISPILGQLPGRQAVSYFGASVANYYVTQPASSITRLADAQSASSLIGTGITVAIVDTGVDLDHPALQGVLVSGYDFVKNGALVSEVADLGPNAAGLTQSISPILGGVNVVQLNASTAAILSQAAEDALGTPPAAFGHGTMTAGVVHLIAPGSKIMPLKAFAADGSSDLFNILRAIYYAVDHGATVISMSFEISQSSPALQNAIQYALSKNVVLVAASGNDAQQIMVYPAGYNNVIGVGSTSNTDGKSDFTNFGTNATFVAAPGEGVITTYPGGNYAAGWGTSFSTPLVAGEAALILQARPAYHPGDVANAVSRGVQVQQMGHGRVDICQAISSLGNGLKCQ